MSLMGIQRPVLQFGRGGSRNRAPTMVGGMSRLMCEFQVCPGASSEGNQFVCSSPVGSGRPTASQTVPDQTSDMPDLLQGWPPSSAVRETFMEEGQVTSSGGDGDISLNVDPQDGWGLPPPLSQSTPDLNSSFQDMTLRTPLHPTPPEHIPPVPSNPRNRRSR